MFFRSSDSNPFFVTNGNSYKAYGIRTYASNEFNVGGNIMALFNNSSLPEHAMERFFRNGKVLDSSNLIFPNTTSAYCYKYMFDGCSWLSKAPNVLPSTLLTAHCYESMFSSCHVFDGGFTPPVLPATTLADYCYKSMFSMSHINQVPSLPATTLAYDCYDSMFRQCDTGNTVPKLSAKTLTDYCYQYMFYMDNGLKFSQTQTAECPNKFRIPYTGTGTTGNKSFYGMFALTGGSYQNDPVINTTYYTNATIIS